MDMQFKKITLLAYLLITSHIFAWQPSGWVYQLGDYKYEYQSGDWYWKSNWDFWHVNPNIEDWTKNPASGWNYYAWPYFYSTSLGQWRFASDPGSGADIVNLSTSSWSKFGQEITKVPFAVIAKSGEVKWWEYEVSAPISFSTGGDSYTVYTSGPIRFEHNGNTNIRSISLSGSFNGNVQGQSLSGNLNIIVSENLSEQGAELFLEGGGITLEMSSNILGVNVSATGKADFSYSSPISASYSPIFRNNLWDLKVGYIENYDVAASMSGYAIASAPGYGSEIENFADSIVGTESWRIIAKYDTYILNGITYSKVVHVRRNGYALIPNSQEIDHYEGDLWLAEGIGIIESNSISGIYINSSLKLSRSSEL